MAATSAPTTMDTEKVKIKAIIKRNTVTKEELLHRKLDKRVERSLVVMSSESVVAPTLRNRTTPLAMT